MSADFDYAVLGGGTAGCALAARLSEHPNTSVCLVEGGPDYGPWSSGGWPADMTSTFALPITHDWTDAHGSLPVARVIGGCSAHNACFVAAAAASDYEGWGDGWTREDLVRCSGSAARMIKARIPAEEEVSPWGHAVRAAAAEIGAPFLPDLNAADAVEGFARVPMNIQDGVRFNSAFAYLDAARGRENLTIHGDTRVDRLEFSGPAAVAAVVHRAGQETRLRAGRFVVTAGAFGSPAVLLRSGIGPADHLREHSIPVICDLPVGEGLEDHCGMSIEFDPGEALERETREYAARPGAFPMGGVLKLRSSACGEGVWDGHSVAFSGWKRDDAGARTDELYVSLSSFVMKPRSRGSVRLRSRDPATLPVVDNAFCSDEEGHDLSVIIDGLRRVRELASTEAIRSVVAGKTETTAAITDDQAWRERARTEISSYWHPTSTCAIGRVVGGDARVRGLDNVYVADASIMPSVPRANTNLSVFAIAERAAELLTG